MKAEQYIEVRAQVLIADSELRAVHARVDTLRAAMQNDDCDSAWVALLRATNQCRDAHRNLDRAAMALHEFAYRQT